jgi:ketosteroid isomerase-like protein
MLGWIAGLMIRRGVRHVNAGDVGPMLSSYSRDAVLVFPGKHSWSGEYRGRDRIEEFLRRLVRSGIQFEVQEVVVSGWPWSAKIWVRLTDRVTAADGSVVYENRAVIFAKTAWGKIRYHEAYEDTQRVAEFDKYLAAQEAAAA